MTRSLEDNLDEIAREHGFLVGTYPNETYGSRLFFMPPQFSKVFGLYDYTRPQRTGRIFKRTTYPLATTISLGYNFLEGRSNNYIEAYFDKQNGEPLEEAMHRIEALISDIETRTDEKISNAILFPENIKEFKVTFDPRTKKSIALRRQDFNPGKKCNMHVIRMEK